MTTVRYFAAARAAAQVDHESLDAATVGDLRATIAARHGEPLARVLQVCSLLVDGLVSHDPQQSLRGVTEVDVLPPFAGG